MSYRDDVMREWAYAFNRSLDTALEIAHGADTRIAELEKSVTIRDTEIARLETDLELERAKVAELTADNGSMLRLLTDIRIALGDDGKRMQPELVEWCKGLRADAERYRWLRRRIRLTNEQMMSGAVKKCLTIRIAYSALERTDDPAESYLSQDRFNADCAALDVAIDEARAGNGGEA